MTALPVPRRSGQELRGLLWFLVKIVVAITLLRSLIVTPFTIPSESMLPRLLIGDYLLVARWPYGYSLNGYPFKQFTVRLGPDRLFARLPERGDVIVFRVPPETQDAYIKRVIGLPGDAIALRRGIVLLNGTPLPRDRIADAVIPVTANMRAAAAALAQPSPCALHDYETRQAGRDLCRYQRYRETLPSGRSHDVLDLADGSAGDDMAPVRVPAGHVFVMGDNRDRSADSRFPARPGGAVGMVPVDHIVGQAWVTVFSVDGSARLLAPWSWAGAVRWHRIGLTVG